MMTKRTFLIAVSALALTVGALSISAQEAVTVPTETNRTGLALTIYNQGSALVRDVRTYTLVPGQNILNVTDVAEQNDATSVQFVSVTDPLGTRVLEQNFVFDLVDPFGLVNRFIGERIRVAVSDGTTFEGVLLSGRSGSIVLLGDDGSVATVSQEQIRDLRFPSLPGGLITRPTLRWVIDSAAGGIRALRGRSGSLRSMAPAP